MSHRCPFKDPSYMLVPCSPQPTAWKSLPMSTPISAPALFAFLGFDRHSSRQSATSRSFGPPFGLGAPNPWVHTVWFWASSFRKGSKMSRWAVGVQPDFSQPVGRVTDLLCHMFPVANLDLPFSVTFCIQHHEAADH
jgi:hypothetical protein